MAESTRGVVRHLGGEAGHRSFFGGTHSPGRVAALGFCLIAGLVTTPLFGWPAILAAGVAVGVVLLVTARTHRGSMLERHTRRARWRARRRIGADRYVPFDVAEWDQLEAAATARGVKRRGRAAAAREMSVMRAMPDGADGMGWLQYGPAEPGIAWHQPVGEAGYLSVAFSVSGQLRGVESGGTLARAAAGWGSFLAARAGAGSLVGSVQTVTRVLPPDTARQQRWAMLSLDPASSVAEQRSYDEVIRRAGADAMVQRHYVVLSWPLTRAFTDTALKYGAGRDGWRALMAAEIDSTIRGLEDARMGTVAAITARQAAAMMLHQQNPHRPLDAARTADPLGFGLPSTDEFSAHVVTATDPATGVGVEWWHRTAAIRADAMAVAARTQLWALDLLIGRELAFVRTVSFHIGLIPASEAKAAARRDVVRDLADQVADNKAGRLASDDGRVAVTAAQRRRTDLAAGSHHHGVEWVGYVTISAESRDGLAAASRQLTEVCATGLGIERLDWQDSYQSAASGSTWPIARGLKPAANTLGTRLYAGLAGRSDKDALT